MREVLTVVPTFLRTPVDLELLLDCLETLRSTAPKVGILVVDDGSPAGQLLEEVKAASSRLQLEVHAKDTNDGFSRTVNVGLRRALTEGKDAILVNADIRFHNPDWLAAMQAREGSVVGARLLYANGLIQHGGIFMSLLTRNFDHSFKYAPANLPEALVARMVPVTGALQMIRHDALSTVGLYDEAFRMGWEDVDYCIRVFQAGQDCWYEPACIATHHESMIRGQAGEKVADWERESWRYFMKKYEGIGLSGLVPPMPTTLPVAA